MKIIKETADVLFVNTSIFTFVSLADVEIVLKIVLLLMSIIYTTDKFIYNRNNKK